MYGFWAGLPAMWMPNGLGAILATFAAVVKIVVSRRHASSAEENSPVQALLKLADEGQTIQLRSVALSRDVDLNAPATLADGPVESVSPVMAEQCLWTLCKVGDGHVAFKVDEDTFLCVVPRPEDTTPTIVTTPSSYVIVAEVHPSCEPGAAGRFLPVHGPRIATEIGSTHHHAEEAIAFYNPHYQVFMRFNPAGELDCSSRVTQKAGKVTLPGGWSWERFAIKPYSAAPISSTHAMRRRAPRVNHSVDVRV